MINIFKLKQQKTWDKPDGESRQVENIVSLPILELTEQEYRDIKNTVLSWYKKYGLDGWESAGFPIVQAYIALISEIERLRSI